MNGRVRQIGVLIALLVSWVCISLGQEKKDGASKLTALVQLIAQIDDAQFQLDLLQGMHEALEGRQDVKMPDGWTEAYAKLSKSANEAVREKSLSLALVFGDRQAKLALRKIMLDAKAPMERRRRAIELLVQNQVGGLAPDLQQLIADQTVRSAALRGLAAYDDALTPRAILNRFDTFSTQEKQDATQTLASRPAYAKQLLDAIEQDKIKPEDVSAFTARQLASLGDAQTQQRLAKLWGTVGQTPEEKKTLIAKYKKRFAPNKLKNANLSAGRLAFKRHCMSCHTLYGEGGKIGPDITGGNRGNLDYILENVIAPSSVVARAFRVTVVTTDKGRVISGIIVQETNRTVALQTVNERIVLDRKNIEEMQPSRVSMMPDGMVDKMREDEFRNLIAYLAAKKQVPLPEESSSP